MEPGTFSYQTDLEQETIKPCLKKNIFNIEGIIFSLVGIQMAGNAIMHFCNLRIHYWQTKYRMQISMVTEPNKPQQLSVVDSVHSVIIISVFEQMQSLKL